MIDSQNNNTLTAIVLAGERCSTDPLREFHGAACKALIKIDGQPMIHRVLDALTSSSQIADIWLSGPQQTSVDADDRLSRGLANGEITWRSPEATPSTSAFRVMSEIPVDRKCLLTTADHPLLDAEIIDTFCRESLATEADVVVGMAPYPLVHASFPMMKKTVLRFQDGEFCNCNLFAFLTPEGRKIADFWRKIENQRKKPIILIGLLGWWSVLRYRFGMLSRDEALARLSKKLGLKLKAVTLPYGHAAVDVDSISDFTLVEQKLAAAPANS